jgi:histidine ammonia-lyase
MAIEYLLAAQGLEFHAQPQTLAAGATRARDRCCARNSQSGATGIADWLA